MQSRSMVRRRPVQIANTGELRRRAFAAFASLLERLSVRRLVVLCLDDVQWGDADSAALFQYIYLAAAVPRFVLTVTCRSEDADRGLLRLLREHVTGAGSRVIRETEKIGALTPEAAGELARLLLERHRLQAEDPAALAAECGGNPLLLEEMLAGLARAGVLPE